MTTLDKLWALTAVDPETGNEDVIVLPIGIQEIRVPMVAANEGLLEDLRTQGAQAAKMVGCEVRLVTYSRTDTYETFMPEPKLEVVKNDVEDKA